MSRPFYFGTNFKMHQTPAETRAFVSELSRYPFPSNVRRFVIPPFTSLPGLSELARPPGTIVGAQNAHHEAQGAFTGEISLGMLEAIGTDLVMIGHAERRTLFGETVDMVARKVAAALNSNLALLLCVGEGLAERQAERTFEVLRDQLRCLSGAKPRSAGALWVAYEPVWSIGEHGIPATIEDVAPAVTFIREELTRLLGPAADDVPLLYGGSVNSENCAGYAGLAGIDGLFVGRAAWSVKGYVDVMARGLAARARP